MGDELKKISPWKDDGSDLEPKNARSINLAAGQEYKVDGVPIGGGGGGTISVNDVPYYNGTVTNTTNTRLCSLTDGSVMYMLFTTSTTTFEIRRYAKDVLTGQYFETHSETLSPGGTISTSVFGITVVGSFVYVHERHDSTNVLRRYDIADLANVTTITVSGTDWGTSFAYNSYSDGTNLYIQSGNVNEFHKYTISGTTATFDSTITFTGIAEHNGTCSYDDNFVYITEQIGNASFGVIIYKYAFAGGSVVSTGTAYGKLYADAYPNGSSIGGKANMIINSAGVGLISFARSIQSASAMTGSELQLTAMSLPA